MDEDKRTAKRYYLRKALDQVPRLLQAKTLKQACEVIDGDIEPNLRGYEAVLLEGLEPEELSRRHELIKSLLRERMSPEAYQRWLAMMEPRFDEQMERLLRGDGDGTT